LNLLQEGGATDIELDMPVGDTAINITYSLAGAFGYGNWSFGGEAISEIDSSSSFSFQFTEFSTSFASGTFNGYIKGVNPNTGVPETIEITHYIPHENYPVDQYLSTK